MEIPENLKQALAQTGDYAAFAMVINDRASIIVKVTGGYYSEELAGNVMVSYRPVAGLYPTGAVIALQSTIEERGGGGFELETVLNPAVAADLALLRQLQQQETLDYHFFDEMPAYLHSKRIRHRPMNQKELGLMIDRALAHLAQLARPVDWQQTVAAFYRDISLAESSY